MRRNLVTRRRNVYNQKSKLNRYHKTQSGGVFNFIAWIRKRFGWNGSETQSSAPVHQPPPSEFFIKRWYRNFVKLFRNETGHSPNKADLAEAAENAFDNGEFQSAKSSSNSKPKAETRIGKASPRSKDVQSSKNPVASKAATQENKVLIHQNVFSWSSSPEKKLGKLTELLKMDEDFLNKHFKIDHLRLLMYKSVLNYGKRLIKIDKQNLDNAITTVLDDLSFQENFARRLKEDKRYYFYCVHPAQKTNNELNVFVLSKLKQDYNIDDVSRDTFVLIPTLISPDDRFKVVNDLQLFVRHNNLQLVMVDELTDNKYTVVLDSIKQAQQFHPAAEHHNAGTPLCGRLSSVQSIQSPNCRSITVHKVQDMHIGDKRNLLKTLLRESLQHYNGHPLLGVLQHLDENFIDHYSNEDLNYLILHFIMFFKFLSDDSTQKFKQEKQQLITKVRDLLRKSKTAIQFIEGNIFEKSSMLPGMVSIHEGNELFYTQSTDIHELYRFYTERNMFTDRTFIPINKQTLDQLLLYNDDFEVVDDDM